jgi:hypothetical protein
MESVMPIPSPTEINHSLRETNLRLKFRIDALSGNVGRSLTALAGPRQIAGLLSELTRAGEWLRSAPSRSDPELRDELNVYRHNIERLRELLPAIHEGLLRERARLEQERTRIASAAEWVRRSRETL